MPGPWEDYQGGATQTAAPWEEYGGTTKPQSAVGYLASQAKAGLTADLPTIAGKALQYAGATDIGGRIRAYGEANAASAQPDESQGAVTKMVAGAIRGAAPIVPLAVGGLLAQGTPVGPALDVAGAAALAGGFGGSQAQDTLEKAKAAGQSDEAATSAARKTGLITGVGMGAVGALTGGAAAPAIRALAGTGARTAAETLAETAAPSLARPLIADTAGHLVGNVASMAAANAGVAKVEQDAGLQGPTPGQAALEGVESGALLTAALSPFGAARTVLARRANTAAVNRLQSPDTQPEQRAAIAAQIHANLNAIDPQAADHFANNVAQAIDAKQPLQLGEHLLGPQEAAPQPAAPLALPAPVVRVDEQGNARMDGSPPPAQDESAAAVNGRAPIEEPTPPAVPALPAPVATVDSQGNVLTAADRQAQRDAGLRETGAMGLGRNSDVTDVVPKSQAMGINANAGPISRAAAIAVDSGAHDLAKAQAAAEAAKTAPKEPANAEKTAAQQAGPAAPAQVGSAQPREAVPATRAAAENAQAAGVKPAKEATSEKAATDQAARAAPDAAGAAGPKGAEAQPAPARAAAPVAEKPAPALTPRTGEGSASALAVLAKQREAKPAITPDASMAEGRSTTSTLQPTDILNADGAPFRNRIAAGAALKKAGAGHEVAPLAEGGFVVRALPKEEAKPAEPKALHVGITPGNAEPVTVKDGIVHIGKEPALDFNSGDPVKVKAGASDAEVKQALKDAGALSRRQKFFGGEQEAPDNKMLIPPAQERYGLDGTPMSEGGKPFKTKMRAVAQQKNQPQTRIVKHEGGFALIDMSDKALEAARQSGNRLQAMLRGKAIEANPLLAFLADHGLYHEDGKKNSMKAEFSPDAAVNVRGYRTVFRPDGMQLDKLAERAAQEGFLPRDVLDGKDRTRELHDMIAQAIGGKRIAPLHAEGAVDREMQRRVDAMRDAPPVEGLADVRENELDALDGLDWDAKSNTTTEAAMRSLGFTEQEITDAVAKESGSAQADREGRGQPDETATGKAAPSGGAGEAAQGAAEGLTTNQQPTASWVIREKATGKVIMETFDRKKVDALNTAKYEAVPIREHLAGINADLKAEREGLTAPSKAEVLAQQAAKDQAPALDAKAQIDREAEKQTLTQPTVPEQRKDGTGDMFARDKAQAELDKKNEGKPKDDGGTVPMFSRENVDAEVGAAVKALESEFPGVDFYLARHGENWHLSNLEVPRGSRASGVGSAFMERLTKLADEKRATITLSPAVPSDGKGTTSRGRLVDFYKRFGFVENKGRNKDFSISESMIRRPSSASFSRGVTPEQRDANFNKWSNDAPLVKSAEASTHEFKTGEKVVVEAFHGTQRPDRIDNVFQRKRATSGPMAFFTSSPELASTYAKGKSDTSLSMEDQHYSNWFKFKPAGERTAVDINRAWHRLTPEQKDAIAKLAPRVMTDDTGEHIILGPEGETRGNGGYDHALSETRRSFDKRGNPLEALTESWLSSGSLFGEEERFLQVLKLAGFPVKDVTFDSPQAEYPSVYKTYVAMQKPLVTNDIPQSVRDALNEAAKRDRSRAQQGGADMWDKNTRTLRDWVSLLNGDKDGMDTKYAWTSIPDKVTEVLKSLGYDGIVDWSGKGGGTEHPVYIPFTETQVKSATGNKGTFDPTKKNISFRQDATEGAPLRVSEIRKALSPALDSLKVPYELHSSIGEAQDASGIKDIPAGVKGMYYGGKLHLIGEGIKSALEAEETLWHEVNHAGIDKMYGSSKTTKDYQNAMRGLSLQNGNIREAAREWMRKFGADDTKARIAAGMDPERALTRTKLQAVEEALSELAGRNAKINGATRFIAKVQEFMRAIGLNRLASNLEKMTDAQALAMIFKAREAVMKEPGAERAGQLQPAFSKDGRGTTASMASRKDVVGLKQARTHDFKTGEAVRVEALHGTPEGGITQFKESERGLWFTDSASLANQYTMRRGMWRSGGDGAAIYPVRLEMKNPLVIDAMGKRNDNIPVPWKEWKPKVFGNMPKDAVNLHDALAYAKEHGHDGIVVRNVVDTAIHGDKTKATVYAVSGADQIASPFSKDQASFSRTLDKASDTLDRIKGTAVVKDVGTAYDGILMATNPAARSDAAKEMARQLTAGMGEKEMKSIQFRVKLNAAIQETDKATTVGAKARDLMEKGLTVQADKVFLRNKPEDNHAFMQAMDTGDEKYFAAHPDLKPMADVIARMFADKAKEIQGLGTGALENIRANYFPHLWNREPSGDKQREIFSSLAKRPLEGRKGFTKARVFDDVQAGLDAGFEPISNNPLDLVALKMEEMDKYLLAHKTLQAMEGSNGVHLIAAGEKTPQGFTDVNGRFGSIERNGEKLRYIARDDVAQVINNYLSPSLYHNKYVGKPFTAYMGAANTLNQFQLGVFSAFHAGFTSMEAVISHASIGIKAATEGDFKGAAKYLGSAPAAWINNPKLGSKIIAHMMDSAAHPEMAPILEGLQMAGFKWQMDNRFRTDATKNMLQAWQDGNKFKAGLNSIPALAEQTARPILEWLVPRQKFGVFGEMYSKWMQDHPDASHEELRNSAQQIWNRVDSRLGQVVYDRLFVHNVAKNFAQMLIRAPGWTGGTILEVGGGIKDLAGYAKDLASGKKPAGISDRAAYTLSMLMVTATANAAMTAMFTGDSPDDWRDLVAFRTGNLDEHGRPERFMLPTYMKDVYAYAKAPGTTLLNKSHPLLSLVGDIGKNKDFYGTEIRSEDANLLTQLAQTAGFAAKAFVPFWMKGVQKEKEREGSALSMAAPLLGVMPAPSDLNKTAAEKLMTQYGADRMPQGSRTQEETDKADLRRQMYLALRKGEQDKAKELFDQGREQGLFGARDYLKVIRQARQDPLAAQFSHLTFEQAQRVMKVATDDEKRELAPAFMRKRLADQRQHAGT